MAKKNKVMTKKGNVKIDNGGGGTHIVNKKKEEKNLGGKFNEYWVRSNGTAYRRTLRGIFTISEIEEIFVGDMKKFTKYSEENLRRAFNEEAMIF